MSQSEEAAKSAKRDLKRGDRKKEIKDEKGLLQICYGGTG